MDSLGGVTRAKDGASPRLSTAVDVEVGGTHQEILHSSGGIGKRSHGLRRSGQCRLASVASRRGSRGAEKARATTRVGKPRVRERASHYRRLLLLSRRLQWPLCRLRRRCRRWLRRRHRRLRLYRLRRRSNSSNCSARRCWPIAVKSRRMCRPSSTASRQTVPSPRQRLCTVPWPLRPQRERSWTRSAPNGLPIWSNGRPTSMVWPSC